MAAKAMPLSSSSSLRTSSIHAPFGEVDWYGAKASSVAPGTRAFRAESDSAQAHSGRTQESARAISKQRLRIFLLLFLQVELHISKLDPALFAHELGDEQREGGGQGDVQKQYLEQHAALPRHRRPGAKLPDEAGSAHAC